MDVVPVEVAGVLPTEQQSVAIFIGNNEKTFIINVDLNVGRAFAMSLRGEKNERPLTHELLGHIFEAFDIKVDHIVINQLRSNTYYARLILRAENEVHKKIIEIDARPSDCLAVALQAKSPIFVSRDVWDEVEDMSDLLEKMKQAQKEKKQPEDPSEPPLFGDDPV
jgi:bifunctional DNase/RNase